MIDKRLANVVVAIVTLAWAVNFAAPFFVADYKPDPSVHAVFMAIIGGTLALSRGKNDDNP